MSASKYETIYRKTPHALGSPSKAFVAFFETYAKSKARILDIGCGQGRDALFVARLGHHVLGVDISPSGIAQLQADADAEGLDIETVAADLEHYTPQGTFDVVLIDRTLHMLREPVRLDVLQRCAMCVDVDGFILIADEKKNISTIKAG